MRVTAGGFNGRKKVDNIRCTIYYLEKTKNQINESDFICSFQIVLGQYGKGIPAYKGLNNLKRS